VTIHLVSVDPRVNLESENKKKRRKPNVSIGIGQRSNYFSQFQMRDRSRCRKRDIRNSESEFGRSGGLDHRDQRAAKGFNAGPVTSEAIERCWEDFSSPLALAVTE